MTDEQKPTQELTLQQHAEQELAPIEASLQQLAEKYRGVVFDVETTKGMEEAKKARQEIRAPRYAAQRIIREKKSELAQISRDLGARGQDIIDQIQAIEDPIDRQITAVEERKAAEKEAREKAERENRQRQMDRVLGIRGIPSALIGATVEQLDAATQDLLDDELEDLDEVYRPDGEQAKDTVLEALAVMRTQRAEADAQATELARLRAEAEAREAELAEQRRQEAEAQAQREADETQRKAEAEAAHAAELAAERERAAALQRQLDEQAAEQKRREDAEAAERARIAQEAAVAEATRQRAEAEERARIQREAEEMAIRQVTVRDAMQSAYDFLVSEGYRDATPTRMLAAALEKTA